MRQEFISKGSAEKVPRERDELGLFTREPRDFLDLPGLEIPQDLRERYPELFRKLTFDAKFKPGFAEMPSELLESTYVNLAGGISGLGLVQQKEIRGRIKPILEQAKQLADQINSTRLEEASLTDNLDPSKDEIVKIKFPEVDFSNSRLAWPEELQKRIPKTCAAIEFYLRETGFVPRFKKDVNNFIYGDFQRFLDDAGIPWNFQKTLLFMELPKLLNKEVGERKSSEELAHEAQMEKSRERSKRQQEDREREEQNKLTEYQRIEKQYRTAIAELKDAVNQFYQSENLKKRPDSPIKTYTLKDIEKALQRVGWSGPYTFQPSEQGGWLASENKNEGLIFVFPLDKNYFRTGNVMTLIENMMKVTSQSGEDVKEVRRFVEAREPVWLKQQPDGKYLVFKKGELVVE